MSQSAQGLRARLARLEARVDLGRATVVMADGTVHRMPGAGNYFIRLFSYVGRLSHGELPDGERNPTYEVHLAWLRMAVEFEEPEGSSVGSVLKGLLESTTFSNLPLLTKPSNQGEQSDEG